MAVRATRVERTLLLGSRCAADRVSRVALQAEERFTHDEQVIVHGPMRGVAGTAVLVEVRVLI